jgi:hypothetical protein
MQAEVAQVRVLLRSPDPRVRALAARSGCPCHGTFELLHELKDELKLLAARRDVGLRLARRRA